MLAWVITRQLQKLLGELKLNYLYSNYLETHFFQMDLIDIQRLSGEKLKKKLFCEIIKKESSGKFQTQLDPFYDYDENWVKTIEEVCELYISEFGFDEDLRTDFMLAHVPLLYQLIDQYEKAEDKLIHILNRGEKIYTAGLLLSCIIVLAKTKKAEVRNWICTYLENTYSLYMKNETIQKYLSLLDDTIIFFDHYFTSVCENIESWDEIKRKMILWRMERYEGKAYELLDEESDMWIYDNLIKDDTFLQVIRSCKERIKEADNPLICEEDSIKRTLDLFYSTSVHLKDYARIKADSLMRALNKEDAASSMLEVFYNEKFHDNNWHGTLLRRYQQLQDEMPSRIYTQCAMEAIQEFCHGYSMIKRIILSASAMISDNPVNYSTYDEDKLNTEMRHFFRMALRDKGYEVCDQTFQGIGTSGKRQGSPDIVFSKGGVPVGIYEGLMDEGNTWRKKHIEKAIKRYNIAGCKRIYIVEFSRKENFKEYWNSVMESLHEYPLIRADETDSGLNGVKVCEGSFNWNGNGEGEFIFFGVNCFVPFEKRA